MGHVVFEKNFGATNYVQCNSKTFMRCQTDKKKIQRAAVVFFVVFFVFLSQCLPWYRETLASLGIMGESLNNQNLLRYQIRVALWERATVLYISAEASQSHSHLSFFPSYNSGRVFTPRKFQVLLDSK